MKKFITWIDKKFEPMMIVLLFTCMSSLVCLQVILRFFFQTGISWGEELSRILFVWLMYFSIAEATKKNRNIKISYFIKKLCDKHQKYMYILSDFFILLFSSICLYGSYSVCLTTARFNDRLVTIDFSLNILYIAGVLGFILMTIRILQNITWKIKHIDDSMDIFENVDRLYSEKNLVKNSNILLAKEDGSK